MQSLGMHVLGHRNVCLSVCLLLLTLPSHQFSFMDFRKDHPFQSYGVKSKWVRAHHKQRHTDLCISAASHFCTISGQTKCRNYLKDNWWVECCFRGNRHKTSELWGHMHTHAQWIVYVISVCMCGLYAWAKLRWWHLLYSRKCWDHPWSISPKACIRACI